MKFKVTNDSILDAKVDALVLPVIKQKSGYSSYFRQIDKAMGGKLEGFLNTSGFEAEVAMVASCPTFDEIGAKLVYVVGLGEKDGFDAEALLKAFAAVSRKAAADKIKTLATLYLENDQVQHFCQCAVEGLLLGAYQYTKYKSEKPKVTGGPNVTILLQDNSLAKKVKEEVNRGEAFATATNFARDLVNQPARDLYPETLAKIAKQAFKSSGVSVTVFDEAEIKKRKMGAFLSVADGSPRKPRFIHLKYEPTAGTKRRIILVGKGVTFDTGGLSLKPPRFMYDMKSDMGGAAAVFGAMHAVAQLKPKCEVHAIVAATENIPGGSSTKPGDVVKASNGKTIEVLNTDAEGRLTLADALHYACNLQKADAIIDLATLTGACVIALGNNIAAGMTNNPRVLEEVITASKKAGEHIWHMPLPKIYEELIKSSVADIKNTGAEGGAAGTLTAGLFLQNFVSTNNWVHLDIAGPAFMSSDQLTSPKGATGFGVRTLLHFIG